jgi:cell division protein FtsW
MSIGARAVKNFASGHDRSIASAALLLVISGILLSLAASPTVAERIRVGSEFYFVWRQLGFAAAALIACLLCALASPRWVRRSGLLLLVGALILMCIVPLFGAEVKGAQRWLRFGAFNVQPSEFLKPAIVVTAAWMLAERLRAPAFPGLRIVAALYALSVGLLLIQPDIGQILLIGATLAVVVYVAGVSWVWLLAAIGFCLALFAAAYFSFEHVQARVQAFLHPTGLGYQVSRALEAIQSGGLLGRGPGEGVIKDRLPDAHADFVYAVAAEEFGLFASLGLIALYGVIVWCGLARTARVIDPFSQIAAAGLLVLIGLQALVHFAVNVSLAPAKGMTLPFVSYGGSSMIGSGITLGFALALIRARPGGLLYEKGTS